VLLDYVVDPMICTIWCSKALLNIFPGAAVSGGGGALCATGAESAGRGGDGEYEQVARRR
jgi:hypothetical protein